MAVVDAANAIATAAIFDDQFAIGGVVSCRSNAMFSE
jgi:hypothetical protein